MKKYVSALAALGAALSVAAFAPAAQAERMGGHGGGFGGARMAHSYGGHHGSWHGGHRHWRGGWIGWGPSVYFGDPYNDGYYDDYDDYTTCYWRHGRRFCRY